MEEKEHLRFDLFDPDFIGYIVSGVVESHALHRAIMNTLVIIFEKLPPGTGREISKAFLDEYKKVIEEEKGKVRLMDLDLIDKAKKDIDEIFDNPAGSKTQP